MHTVENPPIPFTYPINGGMQTGSEIILAGATYNGQHKQFQINLKGQGDDIVLHVNPRFKFFEDTVVLNNRTYTGWQKEERHRNRMSVGDTFRIRIICHHSHFVLNINDREVARFEHRLSPQMVRELDVRDDIVLHRVQFINFQQSQAPQPYQPPPVNPSYYPPPPQYPPLNPYPNAPPPSQYQPQPGWNSQQQPYPNQELGNSFVGNRQRHCVHCNSAGCHLCR